MPSKEVIAAMNKHKKEWGEARKTKPGEFTVPKIDPGDYACRVTGKYGVKNGEAWASLIWVILKGKFKGVSHNRYFSIGDKRPDRRLGALKGLAAAVQVLTGEDTSTDDYKNNPAAVLDLIDQINKDKPLCMVNLKPGVADTGSEFINARFKELIDESGTSKTTSSKKRKKASDDEEDESEEDESDDSEDEGDEESDDEEDDSEEDEDEDEDVEEEGEDEVEPEKGDIVKYRPPKAKNDVECEVKTVNKGSKTVSLKETEGKERLFKEVPWDKVKY